MPTADEARILRQPKSVPLLVTRKVDADTDGVPITYSESVWPAERTTFNLDLR
jgi:GntR family phosphonate transport system transcriptional regulator